MAQDHKAASENILSGNGDPGLSRAGLYSFALIAVTFLMTSSGYLSWLYHLLTLVPTQTADYLTMCAGYFLVERVLYGNWAAAAVGIPWNIGQAAVGMIVAFVVAAALWKTPVKKFFLMR